MKASRPDGGKPEQASCWHKPTCPLFPLFIMRATLRVWQLRYCDGDWETCERFRMSAEGKEVPSDMLPNGKSIKVV